MIDDSDSDLDANLDSHIGGTQNHGLTIPERIVRVRKAVGARIRHVREAMHMPPEWFAGMLGGEPEQLFALERGNLPCTMNVLCGIGRGMNLSILQVARGETRPTGGWTSVDEERARVARQIRHARKSLAMSMAALALKAGVPGLFVGGIEYQALDAPVDMLTKLCIAIGMPVHWVFTDCPAFISDREMAKRGAVRGDVAIVLPDDEGWR